MVYDLIEVQEDLDLSNSDLARIMMVTEGTIRNWRKNGLPKREAIFMHLLASAGCLTSKRKPLQYQSRLDGISKSQTELRNDIQKL